MQGELSETVNVVHLPMICILYKITLDLLRGYVFPRISHQLSFANATTLVQRRQGPSEIGRSPTGVQIQIETIRDYNEAGSITDSVAKENVDRLADDVESANSSAGGNKTAPGLDATKDVQVVSFTTADRDRETR
jgi:hypothetical protein